MTGVPQSIHLPAELTSSIVNENDTLLEKSPRSNLIAKPDEEEHEKKSDLFAFTLIGLLHFAQGLQLGFLADSLTFIFTEKGASFLDLSKLTLIRYPYAFKMFLAPLLDSVYFKSFGKRKTYIIPSLLVTGITTLIISFYIQGLVDSMEINTIVIIGFVVVAFMAVEDIAIDGSVVTLFSKKNLSIAGAFQRIMVLVGTLVGFNLFIPLNSIEFSNEYFFSTPRDRPLITLKEFCFGSGILSIILGLGLFFYKEKKPKDEHIITFKDLILLFKQFGLNKNLRTFVILLVLIYFTFSPVVGIFQPLMIQNGFSKEDFANILTLIIPVQFVAISFAAFLSRKYHNETLLITWNSVPIIFTNILAYHIIANRSEFSYPKLSLLILIQQASWGAVTWFSEGCWTSYILKITHESTASTFITTIYSLSSLANMLPASAALAAMDSISPKVIILFTIGLGIVFIPILIKYYLPLQGKKTEDFGFHKQVERKLPVINPRDDQLENDENTGLKYGDICNKFQTT